MVSISHVKLFKITSKIIHDHTFYLEIPSKSHLKNLDKSSLNRKFKNKHFKKKSSKMEFKCTYML